MIKHWILGATLSFGLIGCGSESAPAPNHKPVVDVPFELESQGETDPCAADGAQKGGRLTTWAGPFPKSLNQWLDYNSFSAKICRLMFESLISMHSTKQEPVGVLANSWDVSDDGKTFTFNIHPKAMWSDGKPVTAEDVVFYYDTLMNPKHLTSLFRVDLSKLERPEVIDSKTVKVQAKSAHWKNFWMAGQLGALPKHVWEGKDFNTLNFSFPVVSGPYKLDKVNKGRSISLQRRGDWWGRIKPYEQNKYNFDKLHFRAINDRVKALELFKKGDLDLYPIYTAKIWAKQTQFDAVQKNWVVRQRVYNDEPKGFQGIAFNLRKPLFQDINVRQALAYLLDRDLMNEKYMFDAYFMFNSFYPDLHPNSTNPNNITYKANETKARQLLQEAGWKAGPDGVLSKDGQRFEISMMLASPDTRHMSLFKEHLKKVGIVLNLEQIAHSTIRKRLDQHDFDVHWTAWGASRLRDPETMWYSKTAQQPATQNIAGVEDERIDELIEQQRLEQDGRLRDDILRKIDTRLGELMPYALLWGSSSHRLLYWNKFKTPKGVLDRYNDPEAAIVYWSFDQQKEANLREAQQNKTSLKAEPKVINFRP